MELRRQLPDHFLLLLAHLSGDGHQQELPWPPEHRGTVAEISRM